MTDFCQAEWERKEAAASSRAAALQESNKERQEALEEGKGKVKVADAAAKSAESRCFSPAKVTIPSLLAAACSTLGDVWTCSFASVPILPAAYMSGKKCTSWVSASPMHSVQQARGSA